MRTIYTLGGVGFCLLLAYFAGSMIFSTTAAGVLVGVVVLAWIVFVAGVLNRK